MLVLSMSQITIPLYYQCPSVGLKEINSQQPHQTAPETLTFTTNKIKVLNLKVALLQNVKGDGRKVLWKCCRVNVSSVVRQRGQG